MKSNNDGITIIIRIMALSLAMVAFASLAKAASFTQQAALTIEDPVGLSSLTPLDFGAIEASAQAVTLEIHPNGDVGEHTTARVLGAPSAAQFSVRGAEGQTISIQAHDVGNEAALKMTAMPATYDGVAIADMMQGVTGLSASAAGTTLDVGGVIEVAANTASGSYAPQFTLDIYYD